MDHSRHLDIDTLRGLACILLVSFHVIGMPDAGLRLPETHPLTRLNEMLVYIRMPLFSFISGYVYAMRPFQGHATEFLRGKTYRLLLPLLTMGTLFALLQSFTPGTNGSVENWWLLHIEPVGHFWFLQALFIIFVILMGLERSGLLAARGRFALVFAASLVLFSFADLPHYFAASGVVYLLPFFLGGLACPIFLMHIFFTAASRLFFSALELSDPYALLFVGTTAGVVGPIVAARVLARFARLEFLLLGKVSG